MLLQQWHQLNRVCMAYYVVRGAVDNVAQSDMGVASGRGQRLAAAALWQLGGG
jgi:hypothetical protein